MRFSLIITEADRYTKDRDRKRAARKKKRRERELEEHRRVVARIMEFPVKDPE